MRNLRFMCLVLTSLALMGLLPMGAGAWPERSLAPIEQDLLERLAVTGTADFFVKMAVDADLGVAYGMGWDARGRYVYDTLRAVATATQAPVLAYARHHGLDYTSFFTTNAVSIRGGTLEAAQALAALPGVAYLRAEQTLQIADAMPGADGAGRAMGTEAVVSWGLLDTHAPEVWQLGARGQGIRVAGIDTGVQWDHPALVDQFGCPGSPSDPACWADPSNICGPSGACDTNGHGTHTLGTIVAKDDPSLPYIAGMAPDATWIACKGCESAACSDFALNACADWIVAPEGDPANRPHVVSNSWGGAGCDPWYLSQVIAWRAAGIVPVFAVGGAGPSCDSLGTPGDYQETFGPTAHNESRYVGSFASQGPSCFGHDPYTKPNLSAPGVNICSTVPGGGWDCWSGTSTSTPHGAGAAALVLSACPDLIGQVDLTFEQLQNHADAPPAGYCGSPPDGEGNYTYGYGYLNALASVQQCLSPLPKMFIGNIKAKYRVANPGPPPVYKVLGRAPIFDEALNPVIGATVTAQWELPGGQIKVKTATTRPNGSAYFQQASPQEGLYVITVLDVQHGGFEYDSSLNFETWEDLIVP